LFEIWSFNNLYRFHRRLAYNVKIEIFKWSRSNEKQSKLRSYYYNIRLTYIGLQRRFFFTVNRYSTARLLLKHCCFMISDYFCIWLEFLINAIWFCNWKDVKTPLLYRVVFYWTPVFQTFVIFCYRVILNRQKITLCNAEEKSWSITWIMSLTE